MTRRKKHRIEDEPAPDGECRWCHEKGPLDDLGYCSQVCARDAQDLNDDEPGSLFDPRGIE